jgi:hypothetical protein
MHQQESPTQQHRRRHRHHRLLMLALTLTLKKTKTTTTKKKPMKGSLWRVARAEWRSQMRQRWSRPPPFHSARAGV